MFLAILFTNNGNEQFSGSIEIDSKEKRDVVNALQAEFPFDLDNATVLVCANGSSSPNVLHHWSSQEGDFDELSE